MPKLDRDMTSRTVMWPTVMVTWQLGDGLTTGTVTCKLEDDVASGIALIFVELANFAFGSTVRISTIGGKQQAILPFMRV